MADYKFSGVLLATDFDGTLRTGDGRVDNKDKCAIEYFIENGGFFTVATGRALAAFCDRFGTIPLSAPVILSNGAVIYDHTTKKTVSETAICMDNKEVFRQLIANFPNTGFEIYKGSDGYIVSDHPLSREHFKIIGLEPNFEQLDKIDFPWTKVLLTGEFADLEPAKHFLDNGYSDIFDYTFSCPYLLEIMAKGVNKGAGVLKLAELLGVEREHIYCAGDNYNDIDMLKIARKGFAPENAEPEVKALAAKVVSSNDHGCIHDVIYYLDKMYQR